MSGTRKAVLISSLVIGLAILSWLIYRGRRNAKWRKIILTALESGAGQFGGANDLRSSRAFNIYYWKMAGYGALILKISEAKDYAKKIYDAVGGLYDDEDKIVAAFNKLKTKAQVSMVAYYFNEMYSKDLLGFLLEHVDKSTNNITNISLIQNRVNNMPDK